MFLGFDNFEISSVVETHHAVEASITATDRPACRNCGPHRRMESKGLVKRRVVDTPSRGKPTALTVYRRRFKCLICGATVTQAGPPAAKGPIRDGRKPVTGRLLLQVQNLVTRRPIAQVAKDTGLSPSTVRDIALELSEALEEQHRFVTPRVVGMDGLKLNKTEYMVIGDADDGHLIGIVEPAKTGEVRRWIKEHAFDVSQVDVFVSDMHSVNVSLAKNELKNALHIADKWHVLKNYRDVLSRAVDVAVSDYRAGNSDKGIVANLELAQSLDDYKAAIMSVDRARLRKRRRHKKGEQIAIDFGSELKPILDKVETVSRAYWARFDLIEMYKADTITEARELLDRFKTRVAPLLNDKSLAPDVTGYLGHLERNDAAIFNYFERVRTRANGKVRGPTTNVLEQRNGMIRHIWRSGRGIQSLPLLRLRSIYHQWQIGTDIVQCSALGCPRYHGPLIGPVVPLSLTKNTLGWRCADHSI